MSYSEIAACLAYAVSVWLAARNNVHTWWIGIIGSMLYGWDFLVRATLCRCHAPVILHRNQHHRLDPLAERSGWRCLAGAPDASQSLFPLVALCRRRGRWLRLFAPHLYQCLGPLAGFVDFDLQRSGTIHVDGKKDRKLVRLVSSEYPRGATVYDARFKLDRRFIFPVLD